MTGGDSFFEQHRQQQQGQEMQAKTLQGRPNDSTRVSSNPIPLEAPLSHPGSGEDAMVDDGTEKGLSVSLPGSGTEMQIEEQTQPQIDNMEAMDDDGILGTLTPPAHFTIQTIVSSILEQWQASETLHFLKMRQKRATGTNGAEKRQSCSSRKTIGQAESPRKKQNGTSNGNDNGQVGPAPPIGNEGGMCSGSEPSDVSGLSTSPAFGGGCPAPSGMSDPIQMASENPSTHPTNPSNSTTNPTTNARDSTDSELQEYLESMNEYKTFLRGRIYTMVVQALHYLADLSKTNPRIRAKREKMGGLAYYLEEFIQESEREWAYRIVLDLDRFGIYDIENLATSPALSRGRGARKPLQQKLTSNWPVPVTIPSHLKGTAGQDSMSNLDLLHHMLASHSETQEPHFSNTENPLPEALQEKPSHKLSTQVLIIGAGASGIIAATRLRQLGYNPVLVEARSRVGGRVYTVNGADIGATIMTGGESSPIHHWCKGLGIKTKRISDKGKIYQADGSLLPFDFDMEVQDKFNELLDLTSKMSVEDISACIGRNISTFTDTSLGEVLLALCENYARTYHIPDLRQKVLNLLHWHIANLEYGIGCELGFVSLRGWDLDDGFETKGFHFLVHGGVQQIFNRIAQIHELDIRYNHAVTKIDYSGEKILVHLKHAESVENNPRTSKDPLLHTQSARADISLENGNTDESVDQINLISADKVIVTVPLALLQNGSIDFCPPLPECKNVKLTQGTLNKIILFFEEAFWVDDETERDFYFGQMCDNPNSSLSSAGYLIWDVSETVGKPCLMSLVPGGSALELSSSEEERIIQVSMERIRKVFPNAPMEPSSYLITNWKKDVNSQGCYAYVANGSNGLEDYDNLAKDVDRKVYFAGEHTMGMYSATVLGAALSGIREAGKIDCHFGMEKEARGERGSGTTSYKISQLKRMMRDLL